MRMGWVRGGLKTALGLLSLLFFENSAEFQEKSSGFYETFDLESRGEQLGNPPEPESRLPYMHVGSRFVRVDVQRVMKRAKRQSV